MYKIGIDARLYSQTGVGVYLRNLLHYLEKIASDEFTFFIYILDNEKKEIRFKRKNFVIRSVQSRWHTFSEQFDFLKTLYSDKLDLVHFTYFSYPVLYKKKFISTIHDTTPLALKTGRASARNPIVYELKHFVFRYVVKQQFMKAYKIITPTETVKKQLLAIFGKKYENKIKSIYEGVDYKLQNSKSQAFQTRLPAGRQISNLKSKIKNYPFFIYVGNFYPHKNVDRLISAFSKVKTKAKLVLIGPDDYFSQRLYGLINQVKQKNKIIFCHNASSKDLVFFYKNALALIHPSLSEGFGLPLIEAAYFHLPIVASDIEVFRELLGNNYMAFNPLSVEDIAEKIELFLGQRRKVNYANIVKKFSFEKMVKDTYKIYRESLFSLKGDRR